VKKRKFIGIAAIFVIAAIGLFLFLRPSRTVAKGAPAPQTVVLEKTDLTKTVGASGIVKSDKTVNIYSAQTSYPVREILVKTGDVVKEGDVLAMLDMSRLENDIAQAELNLESAQNSAAEESRQNVNSVTNAQTSLESSKASLARQEIAAANAEDELSKILADMDEPFDSYNYDRAIDDARINVERRIAELETALENLKTSRKEFDGYSYLNAINEASITLERRKADLAEAEAELLKEQNSTADDFDDYAYQNAINDAEKNYIRRQEDYYAAWQEYNDAYNAYAAAPAEDAEALWLKAQSAENAYEAARRAYDDALAVLNKAEADLVKAKADYNKKSGDNKENTITAAEKSVKNAQNAVADAERAYNKAVRDYERAKQDAEKNADDAYKNAEDNVIKAENNLADAERALEKALSDKERAIRDYIDANETKLKNAKKNYDDSMAGLRSAQINVESAKNSLDQTAEKPENSGISIELQTLNLEKLKTQLEEGIIRASCDGVITEINAKEGAAPNGIIFVIEDVEDLYVSFNVKEYSLPSLKMGQKCLVTTDAVPNEMYDALVSYISPKAVSPAGSTSVEFEIRSKLDAPAADIKIGMNAFVNVITETKTDVYAVPISAVVTDGGGSFVFAYETDGQTEIAVTVGLMTSTQAEITGVGLYDGIRLLTDPEGKLSSGDAPSFPFMSR